MSPGSLVIIDRLAMKSSRMVQVRPLAACGVVRQLARGFCDGPHLSDTRFDLRDLVIGDRLDLPARPLPIRQRSGRQFAP
jgi:hypothetical protein